MKKNLSILFLLAFTSVGLLAQCPAGETEVYLDVTTDNYGYEIYWELVPNGNPCGSGTIAMGGNSAVGCNGGGVQNQAPGGYGNNLTVTEGPFCLTTGASYDIHSIDDWGDGGAGFEPTILGVPVASFLTATTDEIFTFTVADPPALDAAVELIKTPAVAPMGDIIIKAEVLNKGTDNVTSLELTYTIDGGAPVTETISGLSMGSYDTELLSHGTAWVPTATGNHTIEVIISNVNGMGADEDPINDMLTKVIDITDPIPNVIDDYLITGNTFTLEEIGNTSDQLNTPRDLAFSLVGQLWVVNEDTEATGGSTVTFYKPGETDQYSLWRRDGNAWHFMSLPSGIAFSDNGNFATSPSVFDANHDGGIGFTGPSLWSSDSLIYAQPSGGNGSHLDMLHASPYSMGIASEGDNVFWIFDANTGDVVRYDFVDDHGPGNSYHGDALIWRYPEIQVDWIAQSISCHLELDKNTGWLYIVDGGNDRILRLDINSGVKGGTPSYNNPEGVAEYTNVTGVTWDVVVSTGLDEASGVALMEDRMMISDHATGEIIFYDISVNPAIELGRVATDGPGIQGITIGPDGLIWYVNSAQNTVKRIVPDQTISGIEPIEIGEITLSPNPTTGMVGVAFDGILPANAVVTITDLLGRQVASSSLVTNKQVFDLSDLPSGNYIVSIQTANGTASQQLVLAR